MPRFYPSLVFILCLNLASMSYAAVETAQIDEAQSSSLIRYPIKRYLNPLTSPDDKWLVYNRAETAGKEIYFTKIGRRDENPVPLYPSDSKHIADKVGEKKLWSPDGKILAISATIDKVEQTVLVDFTEDTPHFIESLKSYSEGYVSSDKFRWTQDGTLVYLDEFANIMKKRPGKDAEKVNERAEGFDLASNGILIYISGKNLYVTDIAKPDSKALLCSAEYLTGMNISPNGQYAFITFNGKNCDGRWECRTNVIDLKSKELTQIPHKITRAAWSPDGTKLAYIEETLPQKDKENPSKTKWFNPHFFILDMVTKDTKDYKQGVSKSFNWTPDGKHIIYSMKTAHPYLRFFENGIFILRVSDGSEVAQVSKTNANGAPEMSPSGKYIIWKGMNMDTLFISNNPLVPERLAQKQ